MIFKCKNCGGNILYNPDKGRLVCPHCEGLDSDEKLISAEYMTTCANCGAPMDGAIKEHTSATKCPNCGTYVILDERVEGGYKPDVIIPFKVSKQKAIDLLRTEFGKRVFTPVGFLSNASVSKIEGRYVPFFMYDYDTDTEYRGKGTKVRTWSDSNYEYTETSYFQVERGMKATYDNVPVDASIEMDDGRMDLLEPFDYSGLTDFQDRLMSGFFGEKYNMTEKELEPRAFGKIEKSVEGLLRESFSEYSTVTPEFKEIRKKQKRVRYALLPVWEYVFRYQGEDYKFHVNGETGKIVGKTPVAKDKVVQYGATVFAMMMIVTFMIRLVMSVM